MEKRDSNLKVFLCMGLGGLFITLIMALVQMWPIVTEDNYKEIIKAIKAVAVILVISTMIGMFYHYVIQSPSNICNRASQNLCTYGRDCNNQEELSFRGQCLDENNNVLSVKEEKSYWYCLDEADSNGAVKRCESLKDAGR